MDKLDDMEESLFPSGCELQVKYLSLHEIIETYNGLRFLNPVFAKKHIETCIVKSSDWHLDGEIQQFYAKQHMPKMINCSPHVFNNKLFINFLNKENLPEYKNIKNIGKIIVQGNFFESNCDFYEFGETYIKAAYLWSFANAFVYEKYGSFIPQFLFFVVDDKAFEQ